ncbi:MAG: outer membrane lipoprotein carrier protein LolA [Bacteroidales bacterium]|nr:outer membrane lipoprotein carrier protein LolA [Bacteroidales bacterium]
MKRITVILLGLIIPFVGFTQTGSQKSKANSAGSDTEIRNGVVIDKTAQKIVDNVAAQMKKDTPFSFSFTFNIQDEDGKQQGKGTFVSNNAQYSIVTDMFSQFSNGTTIWNYIKKTNEVEITDVEDGNTMFNFVKIINTSVKNFRPKLIRQEKFNNVNCNIIDLTPLKQGNISKIRIYSSTSNNRLQKIEMHTYSGSKYIYTFTNYKPNITAAAKDFTFDKTKYPNVKIVDLR